MWEKWGWNKFFWPAHRDEPVPLNPMISADRLCASVSDELRVDPCLQPSGTTEDTACPDFWSSNDQLRSLQCYVIESYHVYKLSSNYSPLACMLVPYDINQSYTIGHVAPPVLFRIRWFGPNLKMKFRMLTIRLPSSRLLTSIRLAVTRQ